MIIVLKSGSTDAEVDEVCQRIAAMGYTPHTIRGEVRTVIGAVGDDRGKERLRALESLECVESVTPILQPFKLASREVRRDEHHHRGGRRHDWRARPGRDGRALLGGVAGPGAGRGREGQGGGGRRAARRSLQAAHVALLLPGARGGRAQAPRRGAARDGPARGHGGDGDRTRSRSWPSTPTSSRSAPATCRTSRSSGAWPRRASPCSSSAACPPPSRSGCSPRSTF